MTHRPAVQPLDHQGIPQIKLENLENLKYPITKQRSVLRVFLIGTRKTVGFQNYDLFDDKVTDVAGITGDW